MEILHLVNLYFYKQNILNVPVIIIINLRSKKICTDT